MSLLNLSAIELAKRIRNREVTSYDVVYEHIKHITELDRTLNCIAEQRFEKALAEAKVADKQLKEGESVGKLHGVPISIKENFDVEGMYTTGGIPYKREARVDDDAQIVHRLKNEGAIIIAKTNTAALLYYHETDNALYGRTSNPWDISRTCGGSSGGEGAMVAVGGSAVGVGSDFGGSIRIPAHYNGVIGFKSGNAQVSQYGSFPFLNHPLQARMVGIGALAKTVDDARMINEIIAKEVPQEMDVEDFTIVVPLKSIKYPIDRKTDAVLRRVIYRLDEDFTILDEQPPRYTQSAELWQKIMCIDGAAEMAEAAFGFKPVNIKQEWIRSKFVKDHEVHKYLIWALVAAEMFKPSDKELNKIEQSLQKGDEELATYLEKKIIILPVYHRAATKHGETYSDIFSVTKTYKRYMPFLAYANTWGLPSLTIPIDDTREGLPVAVQVISKVGNEDAIFKVATILERSFRGYVRCTSLNKAAKLNKS
ncbi:MAG TPA: amidase [Natronincola sp.]|nr:amidase [Natronincola sp.]